MGKLKLRFMRILGFVNFPGLLSRFRWAQYLSFALCLTAKTIIYFMLLLCGLMVNFISEMSLFSSSYCRGKSSQLKTRGLWLFVLFVWIFKILRYLGLQSIWGTQRETKQLNSEFHPPASWHSFSKLWLKTIKSSKPIFGYLFVLIRKWNSRPNWCDSVGWVSSHGPKGHRFNSSWGHMPRLLARSPVGGMPEVTNGCFSHILVFLFLSYPSLPSL